MLFYIRSFFVYRYVKGGADKLQIGSNVSFCKESLFPCCLWLLLPYCIVWPFNKKSANPCTNISIIKIQTMPNKTLLDTTVCCHLLPLLLSYPNLLKKKSYVCYHYCLLLIYSTYYNMATIPRFLMKLLQITREQMSKPLWPRTLPQFFQRLLLKSWEFPRFLCLFYYSFNSVKFS